MPPTEHHSARGSHDRRHKPCRSCDTRAWANCDKCRCMGAVVAGALFAAALSFVFIAFGSAIGLSITSAWPDAGTSARWTATLAHSGCSSSRSRLSWRVGILRFACAKNPTPAAGKRKHAMECTARWSGLSALSSVRHLPLQQQWCCARGSRSWPHGSFCCEPEFRSAFLLRRHSASSEPTSGGPAWTASNAAGQPVPQDVRGEISRIPARSAVNRELSQADRTYLSTIVAQRTASVPKRPSVVSARRSRKWSRGLRSAADKARKAGALGASSPPPASSSPSQPHGGAQSRGGHHRDVTSLIGILSPLEARSGVRPMIRDLILWFAGVPIVVIILLHCSACSTDGAELSHGQHHLSRWLDRHSDVQFSAHSACADGSGAKKRDACLRRRGLAAAAFLRPGSPRLVRRSTQQAQNCLFLRRQPLPWAAPATMDGRRAAM